MPNKLSSSSGKPGGFLIPERAFTPEPKANLAFNWEFDQTDRHQLKISRHLLAPEEFQRRNDQLNARITENLRSEIRERFCTRQYQTTYTLQEGQMVSELHDEPFSQIIKRGIVYRQKNGSTDQAREQADLIGFERIEQIFSQSKEPKTIISFSPRGNKQSVYKQNFFDVFQKQADGQIQMTRFTSTASLEDFQNASQKLNSTIPQPAMVSDAYFLAHPIETTATLDEILETIELDSNAMTKEHVEAIIEICLPVILAYVNNPSEANYKASVNLADILAGKKTVVAQRFNDYSPVTSNQLPVTINYLASLPVRPVATGCGISGSASQDSSTSSEIWSVSDFGFGEDQFGTRKIHCEECGATYQRNSGKLEKNCRKCGGTKGISCE